MKKNITINLCGRLFQIDEDAYELLQQYIDSLRSSFGKQEGGEEIVNDIEARISELFAELNQRGFVAITIDHVKDIITRIGRPEELAGDEGKETGGKHQSSDAKEGNNWQESIRSAAQDIYNNVRARTAGKRLYRNPNDKMLAGVLSGFAAYTGTDATWWRIGYMLLFVCNLFYHPLATFFGGGFFFHLNLTLILLYIVLAIAMPMPKTPKQVLEMEGKDVTPQNLADVVIDVKEPAPQRRSVFGSVFSVLLKMLAGLFIAIAAIFGLVLLVCFLLIVGTLIFIFTVPGEIRHGLPFDLGYLHLVETFYVHPWAVVIFIASLLLALFIPLYAIGHMLFSKAGKVQPMGTGQRVAWIVIWLAALFAIFPCIGSIRNYNDWLRFEHQSETSKWMTDGAATI